MCATCRALLAAEPPQIADTYERRPQLGEREVEISVAWLLHGTKALAAQELHVGLSTVKTTVQRVRDKYSAAGRPAPTQVALLIRLVQDDIIDMRLLTRLGPGPHAHS